MNTQIDLVKFQSSAGDLKWLPAVAAAFLRQLPQWQVDFDAALTAQDCAQQKNLLHKMKGACYAVAAYEAAEAIAGCETQQAGNEEVFLPGLASQLALVAAELQALSRTMPMK